MAFAARRPDSATQTWMLTISTEEAIWMRQDDGSFSFRTDCWEI
jgi:cell envelope opacity-associated protein A